MLDQYECWKERMVDHEPTKLNFGLIVSNVRKQGALTDAMKRLAEELQEKISLGQTVDGADFMSDPRNEKDLGGSGNG